MAEKIQGRGWGNGEKVRDFRESRRRNAANTYTGFRPRVENEGAYFTIRAWADDPRVNVSFSAVINSLLQGLKVAVENTTEKDENGNITVELNLGRIIISK